MELVLWKFEFFRFFFFFLTYIRAKNPAFYLISYTAFADTGLL